MKRYTLLLIGVLLALLMALAGGAAAEDSDAVSLSGTLSVIFGDPQDVAEPPVERYYLMGGEGSAVELLPGEVVAAADLARLAGQRVEVGGRMAAATAAEADRSGGAFVVESIALAAGSRLATPTGNTRWITVACKFADVGAEQRSPAFFADMYRNSYPGLDHYWREVSYGQVDLAGSTAAGWYVMPRPRADYMLDSATPLLADMEYDCLDQADPDVYFPDYDGINVAFNADFGCCAYGTWSIEMIRDGVRRPWRMTWLPPWGFGTLSVVQHEMGHGFGMLHSASSEGVTYENVWDVMGDAWVNCAAALDPVYGCVGQHPITYHLNAIGWLPAERVYEAGPGVHTVTLERAALPTTGDYLMARVPIDGSTTHFLTIEVRRRIGYDTKLQDTVILHEIDVNRYPDAAWIIDDRKPYDGSTDRAMWMPGETFASPAGNILIRFDAATTTGAVVTIVNGAESRQMTLAPTDDTYVKQSAPNSVLGAAQTLLVRDGMRPYLKFDPAAVPDSTYRVKLRLNVVAQTDSGYGKLARVSATYDNSATPWTEEDLTWNNMPLDISYLGVYAGAPVRNGAQVEWDLTRAYREYNWDNLGMGTWPLAINWTGHTNITYSSKEGANPPQLVLDYLVLPDEPDGETHTFAPTNDAYVAQAKPRNVFGAKPILQVKDAAKDVNTYVKFNVSGLGGTVQSATLRLWVKEPGPDGGRVYAVSPFLLNTTTLWLETGLKWNNAPAISGAPLDSVGNAVKGQWVELDVTSAVVAALGDNGRVSLAIANDSRNLVVYSSKEGPHPPELVIVTSPE